MKEIQKIILAGIKEFWENPVVTATKIFAIIISIQVILDLVGDVFGFDNLNFFNNWLTMLLSLLLAYALIKLNISKIAIGFFLLLVFVLSITFFIIPIQSVLNEVVREFEPNFYKKEQIDPDITEVEESLTRAYYFISDSLANVDSYANYTRSKIEDGRESLMRIREDLDYIINDEKPDQGESVGFNIFKRAVFFLYNNAAFIFTLIMGALGSSIAITQKFIKDYDSEVPAWYLYRLLQGIVMALLVIYGFNAGMLSFNSNSLSGESFENTKYFVGFTSALAGLFSEEAFKKLRDLSKTLFGH